MIGSRPPISPEVRALLDQEREIPVQPAAVRARAMARARASLAMGDAPPEAPPGATPRIRWAARVAVVCAASAALGAAAYALHAHRLHAPTGGPAAPRVAAAAIPPPAPGAADPLADVRPSPTPRNPTVPAGATDDARPAPARAMRTPRTSQADALRAELRLLRQARAAVGRENFAAALAPIAEHARRFRDGRLTEEREALRVKALAGLGRTEEARRAAAAFGARFPHSVLLPAVNKMPASGP